MIRVMAAWSMILSVRRCMGLKAGLLEAVGGKLGPLRGVALLLALLGTAQPASSKSGFVKIAGFI